MLTELVKYLISLSVPTRVEVGGLTFFDKHLEKPPTYEAKAIKVNTLTGLMDFINNSADDFVNSAKLLVLVESESKVQLISGLDTTTRTRETFAFASYDHFDYRFGNFYDLENFMISSQANFEFDENLKSLLVKLSSIKDIQSQEVADSGVTQNVTIKAGTTLVETAKIENPVVLTPKQTFPEIKQLERKFIIRIRKGPEIALFEADTGMWKLQTKNAIGAWLTEKLSSESNKHKGVEVIKLHRNAKKMI